MRTACLKTRISPTNHCLCVDLATSVKTNKEKEEGVLFCFVLLCCGCGCCVQLHVASVFCVVVFCVVGCRCVRWLLCVDLATSMESKQTKKSKRAFCFVLCCCVVAVVAVCCALLV